MKIPRFPGGFFCFAFKELAAYTPFQTRRDVGGGQEVFMAKSLIRMVRLGARLMYRSFGRQQDYLRPVAGGFQRDSANLTQDARNVASDMRAAIAKRGQHAHHRAGH